MRRLSRAACSLAATAHRDRSRLSCARRGLRRRRRAVGCADARGRQLVHDQDVGPAARIRPDRVDHRSRDLRHALHLQEGRSRHIRSRCSCSRGRRRTDAKTFTFQLKQNVHFANGTPLTSADVVFSLQPADQPEGQPGLPARRRHGRRPPGSTRSCMNSATPNTRAAGDPREPVDRASSTRSS